MSVLEGRRIVCGNCGIVCGVKDFMNFEPNQKKIVKKFKYK